MALATVAILTLLTGVASPGGIIPGLGGGRDSSTPASSTRHQGTVATYALGAELASAAADAREPAADADGGAATPAAIEPAATASAATGDGDGGGALSATCNGLSATIVGTGNADVLDGTPGDDVIAGLGGNDVINGNGGNDTICGDDGNDVIGGDDGNDTLLGDAGDDIMNGDDGDDVMEGGEGADNLGGRNGDDTMSGGPGADIMSGHDGDDTMFGDDGNDNMNGGKDADYMDGGAGDDIMSGSTGNDTLLGRTGADVLNGGPQFDTCDLGPDGLSKSKCENERPQAVDQDETVQEDGPAISPAYATTDPDPTTYALVGSAPAKGALVVDNGNATFTYDPNGDFEELPVDGSEDVSFDYEATDSNGATSDVATVTITVEGNNDAPVAQNVAAAAFEDGLPVDGSFDADDVDSDDDPSSLTYTILTSPSEGSVDNNGDGTFTFDPEDDFQDLGALETRDVTFDYKATDTPGTDSNTATIMVTVTGVDDPAFAGDDDGGTTDEDTAITTSNVLVNDGDVDANDSVSVSGPANGPSGFSSDNGAAMFNNFDGTFEYDPGATYQYLAAGQSATDTFTYEIASSNPLSGTASAQVSIVVNGLNDDPTADDQGVETSGSLVTITLTASDPDATDDLTFSVGALTGAGTLGAVANDPNLDSATIDYTPGTPDSEGNDPPAEFDFTVIDGNGGTDTATVTINGDSDDEPLDPPGPTAIDAKDGTIEVLTSSTGDIFLVAAAQYTPDPGTPQPGDIGDLEFTITGGPGLGTITAGPTSVTPNNPLDPVRSAKVTYQAPGTAGDTTLTFEACEVAVPTNCDSGVITIDIGETAAADPPPVVPMSGALEPDSSATIDLASGDGTPPPGPLDPDPGDPGRGQAASGPDVYFLVDVTGSMSDDLADIEDDIVSIMGTVENTWPAAHFGLGTYDDIGTTLNPLPGPFDLFDNLVPLGASSAVTAVIGDPGQDLVNSFSGDTPESQFFALDRLAAAGNPAGFDATTPSVIVLIGDAPAHDPVCNTISGVGDIGESSVIAALTNADRGEIAVVANSIDGGGLDADPNSFGSNDYDDGTAPDCPVAGSAGQATRIAAATGGSVLTDASASALATAILAAIDGPTPDLSYAVTLPAGFAGVLTDSTGALIPVGATTSLPSSTVTYSSAGLTVGTSTQFDFTVTSASTGLSATESVFINVVAIGDCELDVNNCDFGR